MPHPPSPNWANSNWVWQLFQGLPDQELIKVHGDCRSPHNTVTRIAQTMLTACRSMAQKQLAIRANTPWPIPPSPHIEPWPNNNWVWQLFQGMETDHLERIIWACEREDINEEGRVAYVILTLFEDMSDRAVAQRGL